MLFQVEFFQIVHCSIEMKNKKGSNKGSDAIVGHQFLDNLFTREKMNPNALLQGWKPIRRSVLRNASRANLYLLGMSKITTFHRRAYRFGALIVCSSNRLAVYRFLPVFVQAS